MRRLAVAFFILFTITLRAQEAVVAGVHADRLEEGGGGGVSLLWIGPRASATYSAGASLVTLPSMRWGYGTFGASRPFGARTRVAAEASLGGGSDDRGGFPYVLLRGGVTRELIAARLYGEAEWLQADVARQQDGIARVGATVRARPELTFRASVYEALTGDDDISLATLRADYDIGSVSAIGGLSRGTAVPLLLQQSGSEAVRIRETYGGVAFDAAARRWTVLLTRLATGGDRRHRLSVTCRIPLP